MITHPCEVLYYTHRVSSTWMPAKMIKRHGNQYICKIPGIVSTGSYHVTEVRFPLTQDCKNSARHRLAALWWYCKDYHSGQGSWQYRVLSNCPYTGGESEQTYINDVIMQPEARRYYQLLIDKFEGTGDDA